MLKSRQVRVAAILVRSKLVTQNIPVNWEAAVFWIKSTVKDIQPCKTNFCEFYYFTILNTINAHCDKFSNVCTYISC